MKRRFTILTAALALLVTLAIPMGMRGQTRSEVTYTFSEHYFANTTLTDVAIAFDNSITGTFGKGDGSTAPQYYTNGTAVRWYGGNTLNITASNATISEIVLTYTQKNKGVSTNVGTYNHDNGTWSGSASSVTFTVDTGSGHNRVSAIKVTYSASGSTPTCATPTFDPAAGTYTEAQSVSINCSTEGATIYYTTNGDNPTTNSTVYTAAINVSSDMTIKAMATAEGYDNSAIATAAYTIVNIEHAGTEADPYTVADARAAIDANVGVTGVYATGIVSEIVTAYNSTYGNITFDIVDEVGNSATLRAYRCGGTEAANVAVNDIVVVYGNLTKYGSTYEFGQDCEVVSLTHPSSTEPSITVTPMTVEAPAAGLDGNFTVNCANVGNPYMLDVLYCTSDGTALDLEEFPDWISYVNLNTENTENVTSVGYIIDANEGEARTAYLKIQCLVNGAPIVVSELITINQAQYVVDYAELPFEYDGNGTGNLPNGFTVSGLGTYNSSPAMKFDGTGDYAILKFNERPGTLTFDIKGNTFSGGTFTVQTSEDGVTYTDLETYTELGDTQHESFDNLGENVLYIKWIYTEKVSGNVALGNITLAKYGEVEHTITLSPELIEVGAEGGEGGLEYIVNWDNGDWATGFQFYDAQGEAVDQPNWITIVQQIGENEDYHYTIAANEGEARSAYFKAYTDEEGTTLYSNLVTVNQAAAVTPVTGNKYVKVTSNADLTSGQYLIIYDEGSVAFDGSLETLDATNNTINVTIENVEIEVTDETAASEFTIDMTAGTIKSASGLYIGQNSDANGMQASAEIAYTNTISIVNEGDANIVSSGGAYLRFNSASNQNRFRYYKSSSYTGQKAIQLYKKVGAEPATETHDLTINGYTSEDNGWYLIASPVSTTPSEVTNMLNDTYDLYRFNQAAAPDSDGITKEWENYRIHQGDFNIVPGQGYLYANSNTVELSFTGTPYSGNGTITLANAGWNLVGNPFGFEAIITDKDCYTINDEHTGIMPEISTRNIAVMEGVFVQASAAGETVTFSRPAKSNDNRSAVVLNLSQGRGTIDRAIVRFGSSSTLPKFQLFENSTKLYIAQNGEDFAIVNADNQGEMPVSFKANKNGQYTITVNAEGVEMNYLHLIDNMTGTDVDLLQTPSYSFDAKTTDYESRFRLVFSNESASEANFAYFNGSEWVVNGNGTLQVIDVMGRILSSQNVDGSVNVNAAPGVYMIRLINGDNVKTQKVVVR